MRFHPISILLVLLFFPQLAVAQSARQRNIDLCLSERYPTLCDHSTLTPDQLREVRAAERRENLKLCLTGKYPTLCDHARLSKEEATAVRAAERAENLKLCLTGKYPTLCRHKLLTSEQLKKVRGAERFENLKVCLDGRYSALCKHALLTSEQAKTVAAAEARAAAARRVAPSAASRGVRSADCESGHWIESVEGDGKIIKLEDGSIWEVDDVDTVTTSIWLPVSEVIVCGSKMINVDDGESVEVSPVHRVHSLGAIAGGAKPTYVIQASSNDEIFVINGGVFKAKTYCFNFEKGDRVMFVSGSALGACASAQILNLSTQKVCAVWCE